MCSVFAGLTEDLPSFGELVLSFVPVENTSASAGVQSSWTRGLAIHPVGKLSRTTALALNSWFVNSCHYCLHCFRVISFGLTTIVSILRDERNKNLNVLRFSRATVLVGSIGALVTLIAIAIDIAFLLLTRHAIDEITGSASTSFGAGKYDCSYRQLLVLTTTLSTGFWLTLVGFLATTGATVLLFIHRRESNDSWDSDPGSFSLGFLKNPLSRFRN